MNSYKHLAIAKYGWFLALCLSLFAVNLRADSDLSPADQVQAERLQRIKDAENKAAHDKAELELYRQEHPGGGSNGIIIFFGVVFLIIGIVVHSRNKTIGKIYAGCCAAMIVFVAILALTEESPPPVQQLEPPKPSPETQSHEAATLVKNAILQEQLVAQAKSLLEQTLIPPHTNRKIKDVQLVPIDAKNYKGTAVIEITATNSEKSVSANVDFSMTSQDEHTFDMHIAGMPEAATP
jgi:hypothetical protein